MYPVENVRAAATRFRRALEAGGLKSVTFQKFPRGACGDSSELLGHYLAECGLGEWRYRGGMLDQQSHGWIEQDGLIVDITADQFADVAEPVIVTRRSPWHERWSHFGGHVASLAHYRYDAQDIRDDYETLKVRANNFASPGRIEERE